MTGGSGGRGEREGPARGGADEHQQRRGEGPVGGALERCRDERVRERREDEGEEQRLAERHCAARRSSSAISA